MINHYNAVATFTLRIRNSGTRVQVSVSKLQSEVDSPTCNYRRQMARGKTNLARPIELLASAIRLCLLSALLRTLAPVPAVRFRRCNCQLRCLFSANAAAVPAANFDARWPDCSPRAAPRSAWRILQSPLSYFRSLDAMTQTKMCTMNIE